MDLCHNIFEIINMLLSLLILLTYQYLNKIIDVTVALSVRLTAKPLKRF